MIHIIKFFLIIIVYVISAMIAIPILIFRVSYIMSCIMLEDMTNLSNKDTSDNDNDENSN
jgi:hypothetical protein